MPQVRECCKHLRADVLSLTRMAAGALGHSTERWLCRGLCTWPTARGKQPSCWLAAKLRKGGGQREIKFSFSPSVPQPFINSVEDSPHFLPRENGCKCCLSEISTCVGVCMWCAEGNQGAREGLHENENTSLPISPNQYCLLCIYKGWCTTTPGCYRQTASKMILCYGWIRGV